MTWKQLLVRAMHLVDSKQKQIELLTQQSGLLQEQVAILGHSLDLQEQIADEWEQRYIDLVENGEHADDLARLRNGDPYEYLGLEDN